MCAPARVRSWACGRKAKRCQSFVEMSTPLIAKFDSNGRRYRVLFFPDDDGNNGRWKVEAGRR